MPADNVAARTLAVLDATPGGPHELLLVDDGSRDGSQHLLAEPAAKDPRVAVVVFSRNFGHQTGVDVERDARAAGESKYSYSALIGLALDGAFAFSKAPLRLIGVLGALVTLGGALYAIYAVFARLVLERSPQGFTTLTVLLTAIGGMILLSLWIIGEYIGRTCEEVKQRPVYVVDRIVCARDDAAR